MGCGNSALSYDHQCSRRVLPYHAGNLKSSVRRLACYNFWFLAAEEVYKVNPHGIYHPKPLLSAGNAAADW